MNEPMLVHEAGDKLAFYFSEHKRVELNIFDIDQKYDIVPKFIIGTNQVGVQVRERVK